MLVRIEDLERLGESNPEIMANNASHRGKSWERAETYDSKTKSETTWRLAERLSTRTLRLFEKKKKKIFWLNPPLLKIKEYTCTPANKEKVFWFQIEVWLWLDP